MAFIREALRDPQGLAQRITGRLLRRPTPIDITLSQPDPVLPQVEVAEPVIEETLVTPPDYTVQKAVLRALRRGESVGALFDEPEDRLKALVTLGGVALLDRNYKVYDRRVEGEELLRPTSHVNRRWRKLQFAALDQVALFGDVPQAAKVLFAVVNTTNITESRPPSGPVENLEKVLRNVETVVFPRLDSDFFGTLSFRWLPYHPSWKGGSIENSHHLDEYPYTTVHLVDGTRTNLYVDAYERVTVQERAVDAIARIDDSSSVEALLKLHMDGRKRDAITDALVQKGLNRDQAEELLGSLGKQDVETRFRLAHEIAENGLASYQHFNF